jgi:hypothetical protein
LINLWFVFIYKKIDNISIKIQLFIYNYKIYYYKWIN